MHLSVIKKTVLSKLDGVFVYVMLLFSLVKYLMQLTQECKRSDLLRNLLVLLHCSGHLL